MKKMETLTKAQKNVLRLIFVEKLTEDEALEKGNVSVKIYEGWFRQGLWIEEYNNCLQTCQRRAKLIISANKETAALKLVILTDCAKEPVARQACLDVINMENEEPEKSEDDERRTMKPETQEAIMKIVAEESVDG